MAQAKKDSGQASAKKKGDGTGSAGKKASEETAAEKAVDASESGASSEHAAKAEHDHGAAVHGGVAHAHHHAPNRKEYMYIFLVLAVLTAIEVGVAQVPGLSKTLLGIALVGLAVAKAAIVGLYYMHLKHETRVLRLSVALPMAAPAVYALVLIAEGAWRLTR